jgi:hypothetical protein
VVEETVDLDDPATDMFAFLYYFLDKFLHDAPMN